MNIKLRMHLLYSLAQEKTVDDVVVTKAPETFSAASKASNLVVGFQKSTGAIAAINNLCNDLNKAIHYASNGTLKMSELYDKGFVIPSNNPEIMKSKELRFILLFSKDLYKHIFNEKKVFPAPLNKKQFADRIALLLKSPGLTALPTTGPVLLKQTGFDIKSKIIEDLGKLAALAPSE